MREYKRRKSPRAFLYVKNILMKSLKFFDTFLMPINLCDREAKCMIPDLDLLCIQNNKRKIGKVCWSEVVIGLDWSKDLGHGRSL